jgi:dATP pyrophosphohydrolase
MVSCFVVRPGDAGSAHEFLQLRRAAGEYMGGTWQIVRGTSEPGETAPKAALRELREETGLLPSEFYRLSHLESFYIPADETIWHCPAFCAIVGRDVEVILNNEHDAARWVPRASIEAATMWASEQLALVDLCRNILDDGPAKPFLRLET